MKTLKLTVLLLMLMSLFTGCDFFRSIMGKPTSKDIENMKIAAQKQKQEAKRIQDSIDFIRAEEARLAEEALAAKNNLDSRYYIILGSFKIESNATNFLQLLAEKGYTTQNIKLKNGYDLVSAAGFDNFRAAYNEMQKLLEFEFCPEDIWIYDTAQDLHE